MNLINIVKKFFQAKHSNQTKLKKQFENKLRHHQYDIDFIDKISRRIIIQEAIIKDNSIKKEYIQSNHNYKVPMAFKQLIRKSTLETLEHYKKLCNKNKEIISDYKMKEFKELFSKYNFDLEILDIMIKKTTKKRFELKGGKLNVANIPYTGNKFFLLQEFDTILNRLDIMTVEKIQKFCVEEKYNLVHKLANTIDSHINIDDQHTYIEVLPEEHLYAELSQDEPIYDKLIHDINIYDNPIDLIETNRTQDDQKNSLTKSGLSSNKEPFDNVTSAKKRSNIKEEKNLYAILNKINESSTYYNINIEREVAPNRQVIFNR